MAMTSIRSSDDEKDAWKRASGGSRNLNSWARSVLNAAAKGEGLSLDPPKKTVAKKKSSSGCDHAGYEGRPFCYRCGERP